jgi:peptidoglycan/LPS O-acetylase OafA/YrhL
MTSSAGFKETLISHKLLGLDHLRAFAIFIVFLYHYKGLFPHPEWINSIGKFGWTGVDLFFVLSGYLISSQLFLKVAQQKKVLFKTFFLKRFFRIIPAYLVVLALYFLFPSFREREGLAPIWKYFTFTQNIGLDLRFHGTFSHAWSLCIEEQFYLFLPLLLILLVYFRALKSGIFVLLLLFAFGFIVRLYSWSVLLSPFLGSDDFWIYWYKWMYYPTYCRLDGLLIGVSIAAIFQFRSTLKVAIQKWGNKLLLMSLIILTGAYFLCLDEQTFGASVFGFPLVSFGYGVMVLSAISPTSHLYKFNSAVTGRIATLSYAIYLTHKITIHITQEQFSKFGISKESNLMFLICIGTSLAGALVLNKIIEQPFLRLRDKLLRAKGASSHQRLAVIAVVEQKPSS